MFYLKKIYMLDSDSDENDGGNNAVPLPRKLTRDSFRTTPPRPVPLRAPITNRAGLPPPSSSYPNGSRNSTASPARRAAILLCSSSSDEASIAGTTSARPAASPALDQGLPPRKRSRITPPPPPPPPVLVLSDDDDDYDVDSGPLPPLQLRATALLPPLPPPPPQARSVPVVVLEDSQPMGGSSSFNWSQQHQPDFGTTRTSGPTSDSDGSRETTRSLQSGSGGDDGDGGGTASSTDEYALPDLVLEVTRKRGRRPRYGGPSLFAVGGSASRPITAGAAAGGGGLGSQSASGIFAGSSRATDAEKALYNAASAPGSRPRLKRTASADDVGQARAERDQARAEEKRQKELEKDKKRQKKEQLAEQKRIEREKKQAEKEAAKRQREEEQIARKLHRDANKVLPKTAYAAELTLHIHPSLQSRMTGLDAITAALHEAGATTVVSGAAVSAASYAPPPDCITLTRSAFRTYNADRDTWEPSAQPIVTRITTVLMLVDGSQLADAILDDPVAFPTAFARCMAKGNLYLIVENLDAWIKRRESSDARRWRQQVQGRSGDAAAAAASDGRSAKPVVMDTIALWRLEYHINVIMTRSREETTGFLTSLVCEIGAMPYRKSQSDVSDSLCTDVFVPTGKSMSESWKNMLAGLTQVSETTAKAIVAQYPTLASLCRAYKADPGRAPELLANLEVSRNGSARRVGSSVSRRVFSVLTCTNGDFLPFE
ncbi:hypothetical protein BC828DRAFT_381392 [Blastocladiella britannica]|nr:hypothetical protein BC828DRAFT_381392 [Blastocladiella britannica]